MWSKAILALALVTGLGLAACDEAEQGRILRYEKGTYLGPTDGELSPETLSQLRDRTSMQGDI